MPGPGAGDDGGQVRLAWRKAQRLTRQGDVRHKMRRVARAARSGCVGQTKAAVARNRVQHLPHRMASAGPQITDEEAASVAEQLAHGGEVALSQVADVDIVAHRCAVGRRIVGPMNGEIVDPAAQGHHGARDQMGLDWPIFADQA